MDSMFDMAAFSASVMDDPLVRDTWHRKYRHKLPDGSSSENNVVETRDRVVAGVYAKDNDNWARRTAHDYVQRGLLVPAGRVNAGAGLDRNVTLINCFVSETIQDSLPGIQRTIARAALTMQQGGGIGTDYSTVRPAGAIVKSTGSVSSGVVPFMDQQSAMCSTIESSGSRRGAMMGTLRDDHPDLWNEDQFETTETYNGDRVLRSPSFISAKRQRNRLTQFNVSVLVSDAFLAALDADADWDLGFHVPRADGRHVAVYDRPFPYDAYHDDNEMFVSVETDTTFNAPPPLQVAKGAMLPWYVYRRIKARRIWDDIMRSTYVYAEPGIIFIDRINQRNSLYYCEDIRCTNPCGEQPLPPHSVCCLSSVNTAFMVNDPFTSNAKFDFSLFRDVVTTGIRFLDNVLDVSRYPLKAQSEESSLKRRVGLGITGWGDALIQLGIVYGSPESVTLSKQIAEHLRDASYLASALLAKERGPFPAYARDKYLEGYTVRRLPPHVREAIAEHGIRNGVLNTIAPNGTISLYIGNVSSGHEPVFSFDKAERKVRQDDGTLRAYQSMDYALRLYEEMRGPTPREKLPPQFVGAMDISVDAHLAVHAAWQEFVDASISKTINCPVEMSFEDFSHVYRKAYDIGCKGCTTYRPDPESGRGSVLSIVESKPVDTASPYPDLTTRPEVLPGMQYKLKWPVTGKNWYINITNLDGVPFEMFITASDAASQEWVSALSRTITAVLRRGGDVKFLVEQLAEVHSALGGAFIPSQRQFRPSIVAAIAGVMESEFRRLGMYDSKPADEHVDVMKMTCSGCGEKTLIKESGCNRCLSCGFNSCG
jgi:ribonucleoside-diphosphate reductase alpha chain